MIVISFVDLQKMSLLPKFEGCGSKIRPTTPISISNFSRAWQSSRVSYVLQNLVNDRSFIGHQMIYFSIFLAVTKKLKIQEKLLFLSL